MAEKLKDKPNTKSKVWPTGQPSEAPEPKPSTHTAVTQYSTVSTSPQKKATALKPTDDSMSIAMGKR